MRRRVQKMRRIFTVLGLCVAVAVVPAGIVNAEDTSAEEVVTEAQDVEYDLEKGGTQSFEILDEDGEETEIIVEEMPGMARVAKGTYKITGKKLNWTAGFYVDISGNRIVKAHDKFYKAKRGSISNAKLTKNSDAQSTLSFTYKDGNYPKTNGVKAKILNKKLIMSVF